MIDPEFQPFAVDLAVHFPALPAYVYGPWEAGMKIDQIAKKCVIFLGGEDHGRFVPHGTGFLAAYQYEDVHFPYVVTARHVADRIPGTHYVMRLNDNQGKAKSILIEKKFRLVSPDPAIDVAMIPINFDRTLYDFKVIPIDRKIWEEQKTFSDEPGEGDEVAIVGLYTSHFGYESNVPIVRIGHISAMPGEKVMTDVGYVSAYLVGVNSIAGHSGSPVFLNVGQFRVRDGHMQYNKQGNVHLPLGVLIGHHVVETKEDEIFIPQFQVPEQERDLSKPRSPGQSEERRTGFAVVVPIQRLFELCESEQMQETYKKAVEAHRKRGGFKADSAQPDATHPATDENPNHREDFGVLLEKAAKPKKT